MKIPYATTTKIKIVGSEIIVGRMYFIVQSRTIFASTLDPPKCELTYYKLQSRRYSAYNCGMLHIRLTAILTLIALSAFAGACGGGEKRSGNSNTLPNSNQARATAKTNAEELGLLVNIPFETEDIVWKEDDANKKLIAVFRLTPADAAKVVAEAEKVRPPPQPVNLASESWFPAELIAQSAMSGDDSLNGKSYAANSFLQEPYKSGTITRIDNTDYFVLEVSAK